MSAIRSDEAEVGRDMDKSLQEWGRHMERKAVPDRLRTLAAAPARCPDRGPVDRLPAARAMIALSPVSAAYT